MCIRDRPITRYNNPVDPSGAYSLFNKYLFHRANEQGDDWKVCIPKVIMPEVVRDCHLRYGHIGPKKCSDILKESCKFNNMERTVRKICLLYTSRCV